MPLSELQIRLLALLAAHRDPESYVAGAAVLNRHTTRFSADIDIFHDREERVAVAAAADLSLLTRAGFTAKTLRREPGLQAAVIGQGGASTRLEWVRDSDFRFFPILRDPVFGYVLHEVDVATNKALAAAGRREPRDVLDLLYVHERILPLGAVVWAAVAKDPGFGPESLLAEIRRNARYRQDDFADLDLSEPVDAGEVARDLRAALDDATRFVTAMPAGREGLLFLKGRTALQPRPDELGAYVAHAGSRRGHWPSSPEIQSAMLRRPPPDPE